MSSMGFDPKYLKGSDTPWVPFTPYNEKVTIKLLQVFIAERPNPAAGKGHVLLKIHDHVRPGRGAWRW